MRKHLLIMSVPLILASVISVTFASDSPENSPAEAILQTCGTISAPEQIGYPLDMTEYRNINPFGRPSGRFNGLLHTGDDWIKINGPSLGEPVYAIAAGRVTYSNPVGWGSDKGVVIVEHTLPNNSVFYSLYGHLEESDTIKFPARGGCVEQGAIMGVIGDPRPAPHLHFEIRTFDPFIPGPGYWEVDPTLHGWLNPRQFIDNQQTWLSPLHRWHILPGTQEGVFPSPLLFDDGSLSVISDQFLQTLDEVGRLIYQFRLPDSVIPVELEALDQGTVLIGVADGRVQTWNRYAGYLEQWETELTAITAGPILFGNLILLQDDAQTLHVFDSNRQPVQTYSVNGVRAYAVTDQMAAILAGDGQLLLLNTQGSLIQEIEASSNAAVIGSPDGGIFVRNQGTLLYIAPNGEQRTILDELSVNRTDSAMLFDAYHHQLVLWGLQRPNRLMGVSLQGDILWETDVYVLDTASLSRTVLTQPDRCTLVLASQRGPVITFDARDGHLTGQVHLWGQYHTNVWVGQTASDGVLRVQIAEQMIGLDLGLLTGQACPA